MGGSCGFEKCLFFYLVVYLLMLIPLVWMSLPSYTGFRGGCTNIEGGGSKKLNHRAFTRRPSLLSSTQPPHLPRVQKKVISHMLSSDILINQYNIINFFHRKKRNLNTDPSSPLINRKRSLHFLVMLNAFKDLKSKLMMNY